MINFTNTKQTIFKVSLLALRFAMTSLLTWCHINSRVNWENTAGTQSQKMTLLLHKTLWCIKVISYVVWNLKLSLLFKSFRAKNRNTIKNVIKISQFYWLPSQQSLFLYADANILLKCDGRLVLGCSMLQWRWKKNQNTQCPDMSIARLIERPL